MLKTVVSKYGSQFRGNSQHDALEFLLWLLDCVHEDIILASHNNNKTKAPEKGPVGVEEVPCPDPIQSQQPRTQHSFVQEHFQAQYKSSLTCPHCLKQSNTFDPFLCISLPIPLRQTRVHHPIRSQPSPPLHQNLESNQGRLQRTKILFKVSFSPAFTSHCTCQANQTIQPWG
ncbi:Ubiquitin carboxyl-terminal hydrolase 43 [Characodon lateralis]|uniref:ubiquitinyl hydrolase 1 n=1 Tax=Characodon lateralis TaxID=208331 RepID=A0ABU7CUC3_9TELE|nr:Ubiquitin carboxyl-terminal hydrolase 43 [Characodon lateralis]